MPTDRSRPSARRRVLAAIVLAALPAGCQPPAPASDQPISSLAQLNGCWTDFSDPLRQVLCFNRTDDRVAVERGDGLGRVVCRGEGRAALGTERLTVTQPTAAAGCEGGRPFDGQHVECDRDTSTVYGMFCTRWLGAAVGNPAGGKTYILTRL